MMKLAVVLVALAFAAAVTGSTAAAATDAERYIACLSETQPTRVHELLQAATGSIDEASRAALRAALADALYQRLNNPVLSQADVKGTPQ